MSANHLINLADDLATGVTSLKDIYFDQLVIDFLNLKNKDNDVERDSEHYVASSTTEPTSKFVDYSFTESVMNKIAALQDVEFTDLDLVDLEDLEDEIEALETQPLTNIKLGTTEKSQPTYLGQANNVRGLGAMFSQAHSSQDTNLTTDNISLATSTQVVNKPNIFTKLNKTGAIVAFAVTLIGAALFNKMSNSDAGFSTIAYSNSAIEQKLDQVNSNNSILLASKPESVVAYTFTRYTLNDSYLANYQPVLISNVKYVSLHLIKPTQPANGLLLNNAQSQNLSIFLTNYELQKRLSGK